MNNWLTNIYSSLFKEIPPACINLLGSVVRSKIDTKINIDENSTTKKHVYRWLLTKCDKRHEILSIGFYLIHVTHYVFAFSLKGISTKSLYGSFISYYFYASLRLWGFRFIHIDANGCIKNN